MDSELPLQSSQQQCPCLPGEQLFLSDFHVLEELFRSAAGAVFKVRRKKNRMLCVLKERKFAELGRKRDIMNEVALLERLDHPNVIKCYGHFWDHSNGALYMVLEYADSGDLYSHVLKRRTQKQYYPESTLWMMFYQLCLGLNHLHSNGVIHRDIKSLNIMMCKDGMVKIGDLGVSRQVGQETMMLQTFYGTPLYASPELCENKPYNEKTDIWSLGVVLYEIACLTPPFSGHNLIALAENIRSARYPAMPKGLYSESLTRMVAMLLQRNHSKRPSIKQILSWFKEPPVLIKEGEGGGGRKTIGGEDEDARMKKMRESRKQKKEEYELLQRKLREQRQEGLSTEKEEKDPSGNDDSDRFGRERSRSDDPRDLSGRAVENFGEDGQARPSRPRNLSGDVPREQDMARSSGQGERARRNDKSRSESPDVPEPQLTARQMAANRQRIENELRRKRLQLKNMKKLSELSESGGVTGKPRHPTMRPSSSNPKAIGSIEREIRALELKLEGRGGGGKQQQGGKEAWAANNIEYSNKKTGRESYRELEERRDHNDGGFVPPVLSIPDSPDMGSESLPSNEREARLRKRMLDRLARQKRVASGGRNDVEVVSPNNSDSGKQRPTFSPSRSRPSTVHERAAKFSSGKNLYKDSTKDSAKRGAWGEHGLGLPGLAREQRDQHQKQLMEERQKVAAQRAREKEEKERKKREDKILAMQKKEEEKKEHAIKLNYTFKPPPVPRGENEEDVEEEEEEEGDSSDTESGEEDSIGSGDGGNRKQQAQAWQQTRYQRQTSAPKGAVNQTRHQPRHHQTREVRQQFSSPNRRRVFADGNARPQSVHASTKPRTGNQHNLFKVYEGNGKAGLPGHGNNSKNVNGARNGEGGERRPMSAQTSARKFNFLMNRWD
ncbi:hypothetical protein TrST_g1575 [Triparma strigata]|uniref:non-specific serine/threonine protein kinase n=1 Tax=Triparma strigata TaxID=1606541 RepID=A0A9W7BVW9_9STRA|nr:hypothetical protein TrST_g1575 [Triparma strigata]